MDLAAIKDVSVFSEHVGSLFRIEVGQEEYVNAKLVEAKALGGSTLGIESPSREPFSLLFELPEGVDLRQQTYNVSQGDFGEVPLFLVPVGPGEMESIFS